MKNLISSGLGLAVVLGAFSASAAPAFTASKVQVGGGLEYGLFMGDDEGDPPNPYGLGFNLRGGYTLDFGLYAGAAFDYFLGSSDEVDVPLFGTIETSTNILQGTAEVGYDIGLAPTFVLRPKIGLGLGSDNGTTTIAGVEESASESGLVIAPGAQGLLDMGASS